MKVAEDIASIEKTIGRAASEFHLEKESPFYILVDQIEKVWSEDRKADAMVVGLLSASKHVKQFFPFVRVVVFLRTDIYERLQFQDRDKFRGEEFHIQWDPRHLQELLLARARASCRLDVESSDLWGKAFPRRIGSQSCANYLVNCTLMRPRDIIQLANICRDVAKTDRAEVVNVNHIKKALSIYSNWKLSDLQNEWIVNFPFLPDVFVIFSNSGYLLSLGDFEARLKLVRNDIISRYPDFKASITSDALLSILFSIGLLGVIRNGKTCYFYQPDVDKGIRAHDREFVIHPCFRNTLQCVTALEVAPFESVDDTASTMIQSRVFREFRPGISFQVARPERSVRQSSYALEIFEEIRFSLGKSSLPDEILEEIRDSVETMARDLDRATHTKNGALLFETIARTRRHLSRLTEKLEERGWLKKGSNVLITLDQSVRKLDDLASGILGEYY